MIQLVNQEAGESEFDSPWADDGDDLASNNVQVPWERLSHDFANVSAISFYTSHAWILKAKLLFYL
jgi:hypothetical protein